MPTDDFKGAILNFAAMTEPLILTLKVATAATSLAFCMGVSFAYLMLNQSSRFKEGLDALFSLPLVLPPTVLGYYLLVLIGRNGELGKILFETFGISLIFTWQGAALAAAIVSLPLVYKSSRAAFEEVDPNLEDAARTLGLNTVEVFLRVSFPLARRTILAGTMLAFARAMGEFGATLMIAGNIPGRTQTLSLAVYNAVQSGDDRLAASLVVLTSMAAAVILILAGRLLPGDARGLPR